jgi:hypothetical protein
MTATLHTTTIHIPSLRALRLPKLGRKRGLGTHDGWANLDERRAFAQTERPANVFRPFA